MLESEYGFEMTGCYVGQLHPELARGRCLEAPRLAAEVAALVEAETVAGRASDPRPGVAAPWEC